MYSILGFTKATEGEAGEALCDEGLALVHPRSSRAKMVAAC
jgi:hypothetical protein